MRLKTADVREFIGKLYIDVCECQSSKIHRFNQMIGPNADAFCESNNDTSWNWSHKSKSDDILGTINYSLQNEIPFDITKVLDECFESSR